MYDLMEKGLGNVGEGISISESENIPSTPGKEILTMAISPYFSHLMLSQVTL